MYDAFSILVSEFRIPRIPNSDRSRSLAVGDPCLAQLTQALSNTTFVSAILKNSALGKAAFGIRGRINLNPSLYLKRFNSWQGRILRPG